MTATPALSRSMAIFPVIPRPPAAFSPLTTTKSTPLSFKNTGTAAVTALRPGSPTMSPRKRSRIIHPFYRKNARTHLKKNPLKKLFSIFAVFFLAIHAQARLSPLAPKPVWSSLDAFQQTITKDDFLTVLDKIYAPGGAWTDTISFTKDSAVIATSPDRPPYVLKFAADAASARVPQVSWRSLRALPPFEPGKPLAGLKIAIDPGHLGGSWARMEERWFQIGNTTPVTEGDMTLKVAKLLVPRLTALGAEVFLTRSKPGPDIPQAWCWTRKQSSLSASRKTATHLP